MTKAVNDTLLEEELTEAIAAVSKLRRENYPADWKIVKLGEIVDVQGGSQPPKSNFIFEPKEGYVRLLQIRDFGDKPVPTYVPKKMVTKFCTKEDIFIARYGASLGRIVRGMEGAYNVALAKVIFDRNEIDPGYMFHLLKTPYFQTPIHMISRSAQNGFNKGEIYPIEVPLAPLDQQKHIVAEIEKQFSRLDEAVANLKRVKANLKRYKAAVLKAAVEGRLVETEAELARREGRDYETGAQLLQRILETRRSQWKGKSKYKEPAAPDTTDLPELPEGWVCATVEQVTMEMMNGYGKRSQADGKPQVVLRLADIVDGEISLADVRTINCTDDEVDKYVLQVNDLLVVRVNGSPDLVGRFVFLHHTPVVALYCDHFIRARCVIVDLAIWLRVYSDVERCRRYIDLNKVSSAGQNTINQGVLSQLAIPLPPVSEQHRIIAEFDRRLSLLRETESQVDANLKRAERMRQAILTKAFSGLLPKYVPEHEMSAAS